MALGDTGGLDTMLSDLDLEGESMAAVEGGVEHRAAEAQFLSKFNLRTPGARATGPAQVESIVGAGREHGSPAAEGTVANQQGGKAVGSLGNGAERGEGKRGGGKSPGVPTKEKQQKAGARGNGAADAGAAGKGCGWEAREEVGGEAEAEGTEDTRDRKDNREEEVGYNELVPSPAGAASAPMAAGGSPLAATPAAEAAAGEVE